MKHRVERNASRWLVSWVTWVQRHARLVVTLEVGLTLALAVFYLPRLGLNMDHKQLMDPDLPFQQAAAAFARFFPPLDDTLLVVVDGPNAEAARAAADALANELQQDREAFRDVYLPGGGDFFERHALLYRSPEDLDDFVDHLAVMQPILAELSRDPSIANLSSLIRAGLEHERARGRSAASWAVVLDRMADATVRVFDDYPVSVSWETILLEGSPLETAGRQVIVVEPVLEFDKLLVADQAIGRIRRAAEALPTASDATIRVRITGNPALNYEEMIGLAWDIGYSSLFCFIVVTMILFAAFRSVRLVIAAAVTLIVGLLWTTVFAAVVLGKLNVVSVAFGVLFIGLGIDFAIHLGMYYAQAARIGSSGSAAMLRATEQTGSSLVTCALTTMVGFYAFVPTPYRGVAELGLISGTGMMLILFHSFTCFPALVALLVGESDGEIRPAFRLHLTPPSLVTNYAAAIVVLFLLIGATAMTLMPLLRFDASVVSIRDPDTESVQTFNDLLADSETSPWYVDAVTSTLSEATDLSRALGELPLVDTAITLRDFVPGEQPEKLEILGDAAMLLDVPGSNRPAESRLSIEEQVATLEDLHSELDTNWIQDSDAPLAPTARRLRDQLATYLDRTQGHARSEEALAELERVLLGNFPRQIERLRVAVQPSEITLERLPRELTARMLAADGHARVKVYPSEELDSGAAIGRFVDAVRALAPGATGVAVNLVELGRVTVAALQQALVSALVAIAIMILVLLRRLDETLLVLIPVTLAGVLTGASMVLLDMPFNFVNVVALPLLLGIGVDSGIHLVHRATSSSENVLETTTARAVFFSALTTIASFGSLVFASHRGIASMGVLLVCGMLVMLACNLLFLPALVSLWIRRDDGQAGR